MVQIILFWMIELKTLQALVDPKSVSELNSLGGVVGIAKELCTDLANGISTCPEAILPILQRQVFYGKNELPVVVSKSYFDLIKDGFGDQTLIVLIAAAVVSLCLGLYENPGTGWIEGAAILAAVVVVVNVTAINDLQKEKQFRKLNSKKEDRDISCIRDGLTVQINVRDLVVGDVVLLAAGFSIPVDGVLISGHQISCDESRASGECDLIAKTNEIDPFLVSGTMVMEGVGRMLVTSVGESSFYGKILMSLRTESEPTPLQVKLEGLADQIAKFGLISAVVTVSCLVLKAVIVQHYYARPFDTAFVSRLLGFLITGITIVVVAVPEGLPLAVTMALAFSTMKMLQDHNLVRRLEACETMGGATVICSDKTGTLTLNKMSVITGRIASVHFDHRATSDLPSSSTNNISTNNISTNNTVDVSVVMSLSSLKPGPLVLDILTKIACCNTTAVMSSGQMLGSTTEVALIEFIRQVHGALSTAPFDFSEYRRRYKIVQQFPFSSKDKRMTTVIRRSSGDLLVLVTGAAEMVLADCDALMVESGDVVELTLDLKNKHELHILEMAKRALRNIGLAYAIIPREECRQRPAVASELLRSTKLTLVGIVGIMDPVRDEVPLAVLQCQRAGIEVKMVTGDNLDTAKAIATQCNIYDPNNLDKIAMEGPEFRRLTGDALDQTVRRLCILARSSPLDKLLLVNTLKRLGEVVAVTGDGTNDGPALKAAHVGFSMGITGTDVAKEASDIILMDDNFCSITKAVLWGRNVYDSIRKFLQFQLTVNIVAVLLAFIGSVASESGESPLKPVQLLWVNLIMDTLAALALATEPPHGSLLNRPPYGPTASLISPLMATNILAQSAYQAIVLLGLLYVLPVYSLTPVIYSFTGAVDSHSKLHLTLFFNTFVLCQVANKINCRRIHGELNVFSNFFNNTLFVLVLAFILLVQFLFVSYAGDFGGTVPLTAHQWGFCLMLSLLALPISLATKLATTVFTNHRHKEKVE